ncbi:MAG: hypothetical protein EP330_16610 [Deltaproteobacteria bacterium]|nr:MAG: hypothetical protein EP330_16610 [Deltaproteobacteria bacterium]
MLTRRELLVALAATACVPAGTLQAPPTLPVALGWRLVPGDTLTLLASTERRVPGETMVRSEQWTWRVLAVSHGVAELEAVVTGLGAGRGKDADTLAPLDASPSPRSTLALGRDGTLHAVTDPSPIASLPHYALALGLPSQPVGLHQEWEDPIGRVAATLIPAALEPVGTATTALRAVDLEEGRPIATLETRGEVRSTGPRLEIAGSASWDLLAGRLVSRSLEIRPSRLGTAPGEDPGVLSIRLGP